MEKKVLDCSTNPPRIDPLDFPEPPGPARFTARSGTAFVLSIVGVLFCLIGLKFATVERSYIGEAMVAVTSFVITLACLVLSVLLLPYGQMSGPRRRRDAVYALRAVLALAALVFIAFCHFVASRL